MDASSKHGRTLYDKIWEDHLVVSESDAPSLIYIDRHLVHEVTSPQAFEGLRNTGRAVRRPDCTLATVDHNIPTTSRKNFISAKTFIAEPDSRDQCLALEENVKEFGLTYFGMSDRRQGIVHIIGPEQGFTLPGTTCVCGDSHTSTHGAFGSLAFGIGTSEVEHVLATQTLPQRKSKNMRITVDGQLHEGVTSKDVILHIIGIIGTAGGTGSVIEYAGSVIRSFSMEARMSMCNMSIEAGARAGLIAPDDITYDYLRKRPLAPKEGEAWNLAEKYWRSLYTDTDAVFDKEVNINAGDIVPCVTWGTSPQDVVPITGKVPDPSSFSDRASRDAAVRSLQYMGLTPNTPMEEITVDKVFIGSCTNSRIEDIRSAAKIVLAAGPNASVPSSVHAMVVPGSGLIKQQAEAEGLDVIFKRAGFDWREAGCSMCLGMNPDQLEPGQRCASTSNRNFEGRQGSGGRTHLMSPAMAAAAAVSGRLTDVRKLLSLDAGQTTGKTTDPAQLKLTNALDYMTDPVLPSPAPQVATRAAPDSSKTAAVSNGGMPKFTTLKGIAAPLDMDNVDTDKIIPKQFLKTLKRTGLGDALFWTMRKDPYSGKETDFVLNRAPYNNAKILVCTGQNFGCGSSREHAAWSLLDFGIKCVIAPSYGDIFRNNTFKNGMLPIILPPEQCNVLHQAATEGEELTVDLEKQQITTANRAAIPFQIESFPKHCLLNGLDDIDLTLQKASAIDQFEKRRSATWPWLDGVGYDEKIATSTKASAKMDW